MDLTLSRTEDFLLQELYHNQKQDFITFVCVDYNVLAIGYKTNIIIFLFGTTSFNKLFDNICKIFGLIANKGNNIFCLN